MSKERGIKTFYSPLKADFSGLVWGMAKRGTAEQRPLLLNEEGDNHAAVVGAPPAVRMPVDPPAPTPPRSPPKHTTTTPSPHTLPLSS